MVIDGPKYAMVEPPGTPVTVEEFIVTLNEAGLIVLRVPVVLVIEIVSFPVKVCGVDTVTVSVWVDPDG